MSESKAPRAAQRRPPGSPRKESAILFPRFSIALVLVVLMLFFVRPPVASQNGASQGGDPPPERVMRPGAEVPDRTPTGEAAPEVVEACGAETLAGYELPSEERDYAPETAGFALQFRDEVSPYRLMTISTLPNEPVEIEVVFGTAGRRYNACASGGELVRLDADEWTWWPEQEGLESIFVTDAETDELIKLQVFVLTPYDGRDVLEGYRLGRYESIPLKNNPRYESPRGFIRVTPELKGLWVSPHFQLRQFLCKQKAGFPQFAIVQTRMLLKLELLLEKMNEGGIEAKSFAILSGFRTPHYNRAIGNKTRYSRHVYGDAADIYIDRDGDGRMDDLNGDGRSTRADAEVMAAVIEKGSDRIWYRPFIGGLGIYGEKPHRGPFIHVDTRGFRARW